MVWREMERAPCKKKLKSEWTLVFVQAGSRGREGTRVSQDVWFAGWGPLCTFGSMSASPMVKMETGGMTAEAGGGEGSPSLRCWSQLGW